MEKSSRGEGGRGSGRVDEKTSRQGGEKARRAGETSIYRDIQDGESSYWLLAIGD